MTDCQEKEMMTGSMMFYGGIAVVAVGVVLVLICISIFPKQRKTVGRD